MNPVMQFFRKNSNEIASDRRLQLFGALIAVSHLLTALSWWSFDTTTRAPLCWHFFPNCLTVTGALQSQWSIVLLAYALMGAVAFGLFVVGRANPAYVTLLAVSALKYAIHLSDYRLMGNYHYMSHILTFAFLFLPEKALSMRIFLVLFYWAAGLIKFNTDWLSGAAMIRPAWVSGKLLEVLCAYVVVLEISIVFLLLSDRKWLRWIVLFQLFFFHVFSFPIVGWYYPMLMFCFLPAFVLFRERAQWPATWALRAAICVFVAAQIYPLVAEPDSSLHGRSRILAINMLDGSASCETRLVLKHDRETIEYAPHFDELFALRIKCDPVVLIDKVRETCRKRKSDPSFIDLDVDHQIRRVTAPNRIQRFTFVDACSHPLEMNFLGRVVQASMPTGQLAPAKEGAK